MKWRRTTAAIGLTIAALTLTTNARADPKPDLNTAQQKLRDLTDQVDALEQKYLKTKDDLAKAQKQLQVDQQLVKQDQKTYDDARTAIAQMAASAYKNSGGDDSNSLGLVLNAKNPSDLLDQMSVVTAVSKDRTSALANIVDAAQRLKRVQDQQALTVKSIQSTQASLKSQHDTLAKQETQLARDVIAAGGPAPGEGTCNVTAANDKAQQAIAFACSQLGQPYLWGGTGPLFDCSGLVQAAWARAGISLPRTTYDQWNAGTHVTQDQLQPGDLVFFDASLGHVGMYLGGGKFIHDPHTGDVVKISDLTGYYASAFQGGVHLS